MKVGHVVPILLPSAPGWGGAAKAATDLAKALACRGLDISVFTVGAACKKGYVFQDCRLRVQSFPEGLGMIGRWWPSYAPALAEALSAQTPSHDLVHIHEIWHYPSYAAYRAAKRAKKPYVITIHGQLAPWALRHKGMKKKIYANLIQKRILNNAAMLHAVTEKEAEQIRALGVSSSVTVVPNGVDQAEFEKLPPRAEMERLYPELEGKRIVLFLGRIHPVKGLDILGRGFGQIAKDREDVRLVIAGPDNEGYRYDVERLFRKLDVFEKTIFTGMLSREETLVALSRADIVVVPSYSEVRSIVALEAMICGLPLVITSQCQFPEAAEVNAGIVIEPDPNQLAEALAMLLDDAQLRQEMGANGRRLVMERYTWDKIADQMLRLYNGVLEARIRA